MTAHQSTQTTGPKARCHRCGETDYRQNLIRTDEVDRLGMTRTQSHEHQSCRDAAQADAYAAAEAERQRRIEISRAAQAQAEAEGYEPGSLGHAIRASHICDEHPDY